MIDRTDPETALRTHLDDVAPDVEHRVRRVDAGIDGWALFRVFRTNVDDSMPVRAVVREDGSVVTDDHEAELGRIYRSMDVLADPPDPATRAAMTDAAVALLAERTRPVYGGRVDRVDDRYPAADVHPPRTERDGRGLLLTFFADWGGRRPGLARYEVRTSPDYDVEWSSRRAGSMR